MAQMKSFFDLMNELSMKSDKKLPNLKVPVKGKKGVSKFSRKKAIGQAKDDLNAGFKTDANRKAAFAKMNDSVHSADKKPEKYIKPDGKVGIRMVKTDKEIIKKEASVLKPTKPTDIIKHAKTLAKNPRDYMMNKKKYLDKARAKVFRMYPKKTNEIAPVVGALARTAATNVAIKTAKNVANKLTSTKKTNEAINHDDAQIGRAHV